MTKLSYLYDRSLMKNSFPSHLHLQSVDTANDLSHLAHCREKLSYTFSQEYSKNANH